LVQGANDQFKLFKSRFAIVGKLKLLGAGVLSRATRNVTHVLVSEGDKTKHRNGVKCVDSGLSVFAKVVTESWLLQQLRLCEANPDLSSDSESESELWLPIRKSISGKSAKVMPPTTDPAEAVGEVRLARYRTGSIKDKERIERALLDKMYLVKRTYINCGEWIRFE